LALLPAALVQLRQDNPGFVKRQAQVIVIDLEDTYAAQVIVDKACVARFVHYGHDMTDILKNVEVVSLPDQLNARNGE
jgi:hypothetical protein